MAKPPTPKAVNTRLLDADREPEPYRLLAEVVSACHPHLAEANIALAWRLDWDLDGDTDGRVHLGRARKVGDPERQAAGIDLVVLLNRAAWHLADFGDDGRRALLDHELSHFAPDDDADGCQKRDELGRWCWRVAKHHVEEFVPVVRRRGLWKKDLVALAQAAAESRDAPLLAAAAKKRTAGAGRSGAG